MDNGLIQLLVLPSGQRDALPAGQFRLRPGHPADAGQVHDAASPHPVEPPVQRGLQLRQRPLDDILFFGVDGDVVLLYVHVADLRQGHPHRLAGQLQD